MAGSSSVFDFEFGDGSDLIDMPMPTSMRITSWRSRDNRVIERGPIVWSPSRSTTNLSRETRSYATRGGGGSIEPHLESKNFFGPGPPRIFCDPKIFGFGMPQNHLGCPVKFFCWLGRFVLAVGGKKIKNVVESKLTK